MLDKLKLLLQEAPPTMAFEISEAKHRRGPHRISRRVGFPAVEAGYTLRLAPEGKCARSRRVRDGSAQPVRLAGGTQTPRCRADSAGFQCAHFGIDFDSFPKDPKEQASLIRFRLKRSVPFDVGVRAAMSYWAQNGEKRAKTDVVVVMAPLEIVSRYESPFRTAGMNPGLVTTSPSRLLWSWRPRPGSAFSPNSPEGCSP